MSLTHGPPRDACAKVVVGHTLDEKQSDRDGDDHDEVCGKVSCGRDARETARGVGCLGRFITVTVTVTHGKLLPVS